MAHQPLVEVSRAGQVESLHYGSIAVCDPNGSMLASWGDPHSVTFTRSTAKPFQAYPLVDSGALDQFGLTDKELALACASHSGTDLHAETAAEMLAKVGLSEADLRCGIHRPYDKQTAQRIRAGEAELSPLRHNCSGKHAGMLGLAVSRGQPPASYLDPDGAVQQEILGSVARLTGLEPGDIVIGTDGCSAPNFAIPLSAGALAFARLASAGHDPGQDSSAHRIVTAMIGFPEVVSGPGRFDTRLMRVGGGRIMAKGGAEGCYAMALLPEDNAGHEQPLGVMLKVADGDLGGRAVSMAVLEVLKQLARLTPDELEDLDEYGPRPLRNHRNRIVGELRPIFHLKLGSDPDAA